MPTRADLAAMLGMTAGGLLAGAVGAAWLLLF